MTPEQRKQIEDEVRWARSGWERPDYNANDFTGTDADVSFDGMIMAGGTFMIPREEHRAQASRDLANRRGEIHKLGRILRRNLFGRTLI